MFALQVYVCDGSGVKGQAAAADLQLLAQWSGDLIILTDPDAPGRSVGLGGSKKILP